MGQESAPDSPERITCSRCGYTLQRRDVNNVDVDIGYDENYNPETYTLAHCICYLCGHEWVE